MYNTRKQIPFFMLITTRRRISMFYEVLLLGQWEWNFLLLVILSVIVFVYSFLLKKYTTRRLGNKQAILFFLSLALLFLIIGTPLAALSHLSFSLHMLQMSLLYFIIPPLILAGIPERLFEKLLKIPIIKRAERIFFHQS